MRLKTASPPKIQAVVGVDLRLLDGCRPHTTAAAPETRVAVPVTHTGVPARSNEVAIVTNKRASRGSGTLHSRGNAAVRSRSRRSPMSQLSLVLAVRRVMYAFSSTSTSIFVRR